MLRPYLELERVLHNGVFYAANLLYGLSFQVRHDLAGYRPDVRVWQVNDADGTALRLFLADVYARSGNRGGARMHNLVDQSRLVDRKPIVVNNLNITKPALGAPTLLTWDEVITAFHEFGHALHGLLFDVRYPSPSGTNVDRDFVEFPSQVSEMWAIYPKVISSYTGHHLSGELLPAELRENLAAAASFGQGFATIEYLGAALFDQAWHQLGQAKVPQEPEAVGDHFRHTLLSRGHSRDPLISFRQLRGRDATITPLLLRRGLEASAS